MERSLASRSVAEVVFERSEVSSVVGSGERSRVVIVGFDQVVFEAEDSAVDTGV